MAKNKVPVLRDRKRFEVLTGEELNALIERLERRIQYLRFLLTTK